MTTGSRRQESRIANTFQEIFARIIICSSISQSFSSGVCGKPGSSHHGERWSLRQMFASYPGYSTVCVIGYLSGITAPQKIGPMLRYADFIAADKVILFLHRREVFLHNIRLANPESRVGFINGLTGQGAVGWRRSMKVQRRRSTVNFTLYHAFSGLQLLCRPDALQQKSSGRIKRMWGEKNG